MPSPVCTFQSLEGLSRTKWQERVLGLSRSMFPYSGVPALPSLLSLDLNWGSRWSCFIWYSRFQYLILQISESSMCCSASKSCGLIPAKSLHVCLYSSLTLIVHPISTVSLENPNQNKLWKTMCTMGKQTQMSQAFSWLRDGKKELWAMMIKHRRLFFLWYICYSYNFIETYFIKLYMFKPYFLIYSLTLWNMLALKWLCSQEWPCTSDPSVSTWNNRQALPCLHRAEDSAQGFVHTR